MLILGYETSSFFSRKRSTSKRPAEGDLFRPEKKANVEISQLELIKAGGAMLLEGQKEPNRLLELAIAGLSAAALRG